jgi:hypothetical protein
MNNRQNGIYEIPEEWKNDPGVRRCLEVIKNREERQKEELETSMLEDLDFLFEDLSDDGDGELQLTEEGKRVYEFIIKFIN